jgi:hypothetical protein
MTSDVFMPSKPTTSMVSSLAIFVGGAAVGPSRPCFWPPKRVGTLASSSASVADAPAKRCGTGPRRRPTCLPLERRSARLPWKPVGKKASGLKR